MESLTEDIKRFLAVGSGSGDGYGYGYGSGSGYDSGYDSGSGYGSGFGDGYGSGSGYDSGSGSGSGYGSGFGDGYGYDSGSGSGSGSGYGSVSGSGSGYGSGYGYGYSDIKKLNGKDVYYIDGVPTIIESVKGNYASGYIVKDDLTLEPCYIARVEDSFAHGATLKDAVRDATEKTLENKPVEERIEMFVAEFPTLSEKYKGKEFYDWHHILTGSCTMGRDEFCKAHDVQMDAEYSVEYFLDLVSDSYGSDVIRQVRERY